MKIHEWQIARLESVDDAYSPWTCNQDFIDSTLYDFAPVHVNYDRVGTFGGRNMICVFYRKPNHIQDMMQTFLDSKIKQARGNQLTFPKDSEDRHIWFRAIGQFDFYFRGCSAGEVGWDEFRVMRLVEQKMRDGIKPRAIAAAIMSLEAQDGN